MTPEVVEPSGVLLTVQLALPLPCSAVALLPSESVGEVAALGLPLTLLVAPSGRLAEGEALAP